MTVDPDSANERAAAPIIDPRRGDLEDDQSAPKQRSLVSIAGSLFAEISLPKLLFAWTSSILAPAVLLGLAPLALTMGVGKASNRFAEATGYGLLLVVVIALAGAWFGWRPLLTMAERNFWALNALAVQPGYLLWRETMRHLIERALKNRTGAELARIRSASCLAAGLVLMAVAGLVAYLVWPATQWVGSVGDLMAPKTLVLRTLANAVLIMSVYLAVAALVWAVADAAGDALLDLESFDEAPPNATVWRIAHLSDIHVVGERYGFRIESGRAGPRGNERLTRALDRLAALHETAPIDLIVVSGDMTDAGSSAEWAAFLDILADYPALAPRMLLAPGNHDTNIVDRSNPARLNLPFSPIKTLRKMRALSVVAAVQGDRVHTVAAKGAGFGPALADALEPRRREIADFADAGGVRTSARLADLWDGLYPMILPPATADGLGVALLDSNADTNFSFTNALGLVSTQQVRRLIAALDACPHARWIVALHHHVIEYPMPVAALSERIATALINGGWFVRALRPYAHRVVVLHGHRHIDWFGTCGALKIVSAPSPVMGRPEKGTHFYVHSLSAGAGGSIRLLAPHRIDLAPESSAGA
jgi:3',5'-cyclic AMP phosphodiesterase CpdA